MVVFIYVFRTSKWSETSMVYSYVLTWLLPPDWDLPVLQVKNIIVLFFSGISVSASETTISPFLSFSGSPQAGTEYQLSNKNNETTS